MHTHMSSRTDLSIFPLSASLSTSHVTTPHSRFPFDRLQSWVGDADSFYMHWAPSISLAHQSVAINLGLIEGEHFLFGILKIVLITEV